MDETSISKTLLTDYPAYKSAQHRSPRNNGACMGHGCHIDNDLERNDHNIENEVEDKISAANVVELRHIKLLSEPKCTAN